LGLAFDAAPYENGKMSTDNEKFIKMGHLGQQVGLEWGELSRALWIIRIINLLLD